MLDKNKIAIDRKSAFKALAKKYPEEPLIKYIRGCDAMLKDISGVKRGEPIKAAYQSESMSTVSSDTIANNLVNIFSHEISKPTTIQELVPLLREKGVELPDDLHSAKSKISAVIRHRPKTFRSIKTSSREPMRYHLPDSKNEKTELSNALEL